VRHLNFKSIHKCIYYQYNNRVHVYIVKDWYGKEIEKLGYDLDLEDIDEQNAPGVNSINLGYCIQGYKDCCVILKLKSYPNSNIEPYHLAKGLVELISEVAVDDYNISYGRLIDANAKNTLAALLSN
jgi:hypothetical protein